MNVSDAVEKRSSIRTFSDAQVPDAVLRRVLERAARAPSGGNLQPWHIYVLNGPAMTRFKAHMEERLFDRERQEDPAYVIYPKGLKEPYRSRRFKVGEDMYALLGIAREDRSARLTWLLNNYRFFGAPAGLFCFVDRIMGPPQWSDLGMYLQTVMLLLTEEGYDTCAQEAWSNFPDTVASYVGAPADHMLFCGMAIGRADPEAPVNTLRADRAPLAETVTFLE